jgi:drug/metabolite transporter (DMT)-like permease
MTSVANATLLVNMAPIFVTLGGWLLFRQPVTRYFLLGLAVSIAGVIVLKGGVAAWGEGDVRGDLLSLGASVFYAGYLLTLGRARERFSTGVVMLWSTVAAAIFTLPLALLWDGAVWPVTLGAWAVLLALGWVTHAGGQGLVAYALAWLPTTFSSLTLLIQPVVAAILAWMFLAEPLTAFQIAGGVIVIAGIIVAKRG